MQFAWKSAQTRPPWVQALPVGTPGVQTPPAQAPAHWVQAAPPVPQSP